MEANTPPDLVKQPLVMERREKSEKKELMEEVGRIETFRLEEAFLNACRDGNLPVVRLCLEHRTVQGVVGVADFGITNETKLEMIELVKKETERRSLQRNTQKKKSTMRQDMGPSQFIAQQAKEKVKKLLEALEDTQRIKMLRFQEFMETNRREFAEKQKLDLENFMESVEKAWHKFLEQQENQKNSFRSQLEMQKSVFLAMQKETQDEFLANEELSLTKFQEKQVEERAMLQTKGDDLEEVSANSLPPTQYAYFDHLTSSYPQTEVRREMPSSLRRHSESWTDRSGFRGIDTTEEGRRVSCPVPSSPPVFREARRHSAQALLQSRESSTKPGPENGSHQNGDSSHQLQRQERLKRETSHQSRESSLQPSGGNVMKRDSSLQSKEATGQPRDFSRERSSKSSLERGSRSREFLNQDLPTRNFTDESQMRSRTSSRQGDIVNPSGSPLLSQQPLSLGVPAKYPSLFEHPHTASQHLHLAGHQIHSAGQYPHSAGPRALSAGQLGPTTPSVTPPSPSAAPTVRNPLLRQKTLPSPSSSVATRPTSSSSLSPSPVPSLEWVSQGEPILTIPDTCPAIQALLAYTPDLDLSSPELWRTWPPTAPLPRATVLPNKTERRNSNSTTSSRKSSPQKKNSPSLERQTHKSGPLPVERRYPAAKSSFDDTTIECLVPLNQNIKTFERELDVSTPERKITLASKPQQPSLPMDPPLPTFRPSPSPLAAQTVSPSVTKSCPINSTSKPLAMPLPSTPPRPVASVTPVKSVAEPPSQKQPEKEPQLLLTATSLAKPLTALAATPKMVRKPVMEILPEDSGEEDDEISSLTKEGVNMNKNPSFANLLNEMQPSPPEIPNGSHGKGMFYLQEEEEQKDEVYSSSFTNDEDDSEDVYRTITNNVVGIDALKEALIHKETSAASLASSSSSTDFQSFHTSPTNELDQKCTIT